MWWTEDDCDDTFGWDHGISFSRSSDYGATWTVPARLNTNAGSDYGDAKYPHVTPDGQGNWVAAWVSRDSFGGTIGWDYDILFTRFRSIGTDCNCNAVADECEGGTGDTNGDGVVTLMDYLSFADCMTKPCRLDLCVPALYADACCVLVDMDDDGDIDLADFALFQTALTTP